jgi:SNF2 family DNA or RNA helicase
MNTNTEFELLVKERMVRFHTLLNNAKFDFKQYQYNGVEWCIRNELCPNPIQHVRGGFIADEMGLGKTIQMIGTMFVNFLKRTLIVVPPILLQQWVTEIKRTSGHNILVYYGKVKNDICNEVLENAPIVITTYSTLQQNNCKLFGLPWSRIIYDEAHHLRNLNRRFFTCSKLRARVRWLVTGTPIQNRLKDFYNLCSAIGFSSEFYKSEENIKIIQSNFILRRTKAQVGIELPDVIEEVIPIEWKNQSERSLAEEIHALIPNQTGVSKEKLKHIYCVFGKGGALTALLRAKQSCILPDLMRQNIELFEEIGFPKEKYIEALEFHSKIDKVVSYVVDRKDNGNGKIIFCQFTREMDLIKKELEINGILDIKLYDARTSKTINFEERSEVLIIQIQTGCEGLNLQEHYSEIYFVGPNWNPSIEDQAIARCHRIGQKKLVHVFRFYMNNFEDEEITLEIYVNKTQTLKRQTIQTLLQ